MANKVDLFCLMEEKRSVSKREFRYCWCVLRRSYNECVDGTVNYLSVPPKTGQCGLKGEEPEICVKVSMRPWKL